MTQNETLTTKIEMATKTSDKPGVLTKSIVSGKWMMLGYIVQKMIGLVSFLILARILVPADFGIMAIVLVVPKFLQTTIEVGFGQTIMQREGDIKRFLNPTWTLNILKAVFIVMVLMIAGPFVARFFHAESAQLAIQLGGLLVLINELSNIGETYLFKELDFKKIFIRNTVRDASYVVVSLLVILWSRSYWALIAGTFASYITQTILTYILHPYRPSISFKFGVLRDLFGFGKWFAVQGWINQLYSFLESSAVGRIAGVSNMGLYSKAKNLASVAPGFLSSVITPVSFPAYAKIKDDKEKIREGFVKSMHLVSFFLIPAIILIFAGGEKIILIMLGPQWLPMIETLRIFLIYFLFSTVVDIVCALLNGIGHPDVKTKLDMTKMIITITSLFYLTSRYNIVGAASALLIGITPVLLIGIYYLKKLTSITFRDLIATASTPIIISLLFLLPTTLLRERMLQLSPLFFIILISFLGLLYILSIYVIGTKLNYGPYKTLRLISKHIK